VVALIKELNRMTEHKKIWIVAMYVTEWQNDPSFSELAFTSENGAKDYLEDWEQADEDRFGALLGPFYVVEGE
jgi:hypothetical protein